VYLSLKKQRDRDTVESRVWSTALGALGVPFAAESPRDCFFIKMKKTVSSRLPAPESPSVLDVSPRRESRSLYVEHAGHASDSDGRPDAADPHCYAPTSSDGAMQHHRWQRNDHEHC
jgi:hypothetical protein